MSSHNNIEFNESGMNFIFPSTSTFLPEKSSLYKKLSLGNGIKSCDIISLDNHKLLLIEAKTTSPNYEVPSIPSKLIEYAEEIHFKIIHSLLLLLGLIKNRPYIISENLPEDLKKIDLTSIEIVPILIAKNNKKEWNISTSEYLNKHIKGITKAFKINDLIVINEEQAQKKGWVSQTF